MQVNSGLLWMLAVHHSLVDGPALLSDADLCNSWCVDLLIALYGSTYVTHPFALVHAVTNRL